MIFILDPKKKVVLSWSKLVSLFFCQEGGLRDSLKICGLICLEPSPQPEREGPHSVVVRFSFVLALVRPNPIWLVSWVEVLLGLSR